MVLFGTPKKCKNCIHYSKITDIVGYCTLIKVIDTGSTVVLDSKQIFDKLHGTDNNMVRKHVIIRGNFGCVFWEKKK